TPEDNASPTAAPTRGKLPKNCLSKDDPAFIAGLCDLAPGVTESAPADAPSTEAPVGTTEVASTSTDAPVPDAPVPAKPTGKLPKNCLSEQDPAFIAGLCELAPGVTPSQTGSSPTTEAPVAT